MFCFPVQFYWCTILQRVRQVLDTYHLYLYLYLCTVFLFVHSFAESTQSGTSIKDLKFVFVFLFLHHIHIFAPYLYFGTIFVFLHRICICAPYCGALRVGQVLETGNLSGQLPPPLQSNAVFPNFFGNLIFSFEK